MAENYIKTTKINGTNFQKNCVFDYRSHKCANRVQLVFS